jgi:phosphoribosylformylglycinamidine cyclo-ligase
MEWPGGGSLVAATMDGVGTKLHLALAAGRVGDAAADLVYHGANDLLVHGARPVAFLDYIAQARLDPEVVVPVVDGIARACREVGAALLGGETAEMPDTYLDGVIDVAGCMIGVVLPGQLLDGSRARPGDVVLGLESQGLHTNGYSLARRILARSGRRLADPLPGDSRTLGQALLAPHRAYGPALQPLVDRGSVHALAHVTGGGIAGNLSRVLPIGVCARIDGGSWPRPAIFRWLMEQGAVPEDDARTAFNLGIGMIVIVAPEQSSEVRRALGAAGEIVREIGRLEAGTRTVHWLDS